MTGQPPEPWRRPSQTKIVATVGPACGDRERLLELIRAGVDVFRINTAHGTREEHDARVRDIRQASEQAGQVVAILVDLAGPKIRLGQLPGGECQFVTGDEVRFVRGSESSDSHELTTTYARLLDELDIGDRVVLADGLVALAVENVDADAATCRVVQGGAVRSRQGVNLPGVKLSVPALSQKDRENAVWAAQAGADYIGLSFVRRDDELRELKALITAEASEAHVVAKIEKPEALENLEAIVQTADAVMVARGDLGVEIDIAEVPIVQKQIIATCRRYRKPVIVATQMLDSMQRSRIPTRAEATDVATAILDGADACMLSGETAVGQYPREAVEMMHRIALATEELAKRQTAQPHQAPYVEGLREITEATTDAAGRLAEQLDARILLVASASGHTALVVAKHRHYVPVVGVSDSHQALRRMCLYWGVIPLAGAPVDQGEQLLEHVVDKGRSSGYLAAGDRVVMVFGTGIRSSRHNMIVVHQIE